MDLTNSPLEARLLENCPDSKVAKVAREFDVPRPRLTRRLQGRGPRNGNSAFHTKLTVAEEKALCRYMDRLDNINLAVRREFIQDTANGIVPEDIWNMDETGFQIGVGKDQLVVTRRRRSQYFGLPVNRESATAIEAVSAGAKVVVPLFLILSGQMHMSQWYQVKELEGDAVIGTSPTGYSNDRHSLNWLEHLDRDSAAGTVGSKRLLLMDGYSSHTTKEFVQYCEW